MQQNWKVQKLFLSKQFACRNTRCVRGHIATSLGVGWCGSEKTDVQEKTLQQEGRRLEEDVLGTFVQIFFILAI
jgi:hypothetical protein